MQVDRNARSKFDSQILNGDPIFFKPNTMDRVVANYVHAQTPGVSESDLEAYAFGEAANTGYGGRRPESYLQNRGIR